MTSPVPGVTYPDPVTWAKGMAITVPRLRGDMTNLAALMISARPLVQCFLLSNIQQLTANTPTSLYASDISLNNWQVAGLVTTSGFLSAATFTAPLTGYYLCTMSIEVSAVSTTGQQVFAGTGFTTTQNGGGATSRDGGVVPMIGISNGTTATIGADVYQFNSFESDTLQWYGTTNLPAANNSVNQAYMTAEWIGLPTSGQTGYTGPYGTVVSSPPVPAAFPSRQGTYLTNSGGIAAGATSVTVHDATGIVTGGTLGLDVIAGQYYQPVAEQVTVTSVAGTTIGISATSYGHALLAPVAVPVSAAFLNTYSTDLINFLAYPPVLRASQSSAQSIPSQTFTAATQLTSLSGDTDTFSGLASNAYTIPVSGTYLVYAQAYLAGSTTAFQMACGIAVNGGTVDWGSVIRSDTTSNATPFCAPYCRTLRLTAGNTVTMYVSQNSGSSMNTMATTQQKSHMLIVFRSY